jgi:hypothetical protein
MAQFAEIELTPEHIIEVRQAAAERLHNKPKPWEDDDDETQAMWED